MKAFVNSKIDSRGILRVEKALKDYTPDNITITDNEHEADFIVAHVNGRVEQTTARLEKLAKPYAIIQYCLRSTQKPHTKDWTSLWKKSKLVWSYYDLPFETALDNEDFVFPFYYAPLAADPTIFKPLDSRGDVFDICTVGLSYLAESVRECFWASKNTNKRHVHLGAELNHPEIKCFYDLTDEQVAVLYNDCKYVSGLRRHEGFELPAVEALFCGSRPIMFDTPNYRQWFDGLAVFIPENGRGQIIKSVEDVLTGEYVPVTESEIEEAKRRFNWKTIVENFWRLL